MKKIVLFFAILVLPGSGFAVCDSEAFETCMDQTCFSAETDICQCHSDFLGQAERMDSLAQARDEVQKILSNDLEMSADGQEVSLDSRIKRLERLLSPATDEALPSFDDSLLGEEMMPAGSAGTNYGKTLLTRGWNLCQSYVADCEGDKMLSLQTYSQKAQQACSKLAAHLDKEAASIRDIMNQSRSLAENTQARVATTRQANESSCAGELESCMRLVCKGIYYTQCYAEAACDKNDSFGCEKSVKAVFESKKSQCSKELSKCGIQETQTWKNFLDDRIDDLPDFLDKL